MKPAARAPGINRRTLLYAAAVLPTPALLRITSAVAQDAESPLASWNDGPAKQAIIDFVRATTEQVSPNLCRPKNALRRLIKMAPCGSSTPCTRKLFIASSVSQRW